MRRFWLPAAIAAALAAAVSAGGQRPSAQTTDAPPRLLVLLVVDQLRSGDLDLHRARWRGGIRTLLEEGAQFTRTEYPYLNTATCAGHATIGTGTLPRTHGIVLNRWWDREAARSVSCTEDPAAAHVSYGAPAEGGNSATRILAPALADELRMQRQGARVVSLALKARSAIALGGHGPGLVTWFDDGARSFVTTRPYSTEPIGIVRSFIEGDSPEASLGEAWHLDLPESSYRNADLRKGERPKAGWTALFPHALTGAKGADAQFFERWQKSPRGDAYLSRMAAAVLDDLQLGQGAAPDYLAVSFSGLDLVGHDFGPDSREAEDLLMQLDVSLGALLARLDAALGRDGYVVALTSDHGTAPVPEQVDGGRIASEDLTQLLEQTIASRWGQAGSPYVAWVGPGSVYFANGVFERLKGDPTALEAVLDALASVPGVARVLRGDQLRASDDDPFVRATLAGYVAARSGDLFFVPRRHWIYELRSENDATNHGTPHDYDKRVPLVLRGHGIRQGRYSADTTPADLAPTLAHLAGIQMPRAEGRVLREALR